MLSKSTQTFSQYLPVAKRDRQWGLFVTTVGESITAPGEAYPPVRHPAGCHLKSREGRTLREYQLIYISAGEGWFKSSASKDLHIVAGRMILLFPGVWHNYAPETATGWDEHWIGFNGSWARSLQKQGFFKPAEPVWKVRSEEAMLRAFREVMEHARSDVPALQQVLAGAAARILGLLYSAEQFGPSGDGVEHALTRQAVLRLRDNLDKPVNIAELADELKVSYRSLRRAFSRFTGMSPHHYLVEMRLARARDLLVQTKLSTKEIALRVGFEDPQYFCRLFHLKVGLPPGAWREKARK